MAERVVGIGLPVVVAGLNVTFAGDDLDNEYYDIIVADGATHYIYNITQNDTQLITAKSGTEAGGYTFAVAAAVGWVTGDYCVPCTTNDKLQYATMVLLRAAIANGDRALVTRPAAKCPFWPEYIVSATQSFSAWGLLARQRLLIQGGYSAANFGPSGDLTGHPQVTVRNLVLLGNAHGIQYNDTGAAQTGGGLIADRCVIVGAGGHGVYHTKGTGAAVVVRRCLILDCAIGIRVAATASGVTIRQTTVAFCNYGLYEQLGASVLKNVALLFNRSGDSNEAAGTVATYSADSDGTLPAGTGNQFSVTRAQAALWGDNDNHYFAAGGRILSTSVLASAGDYQAGQPTTDIDGADITTGCPIGCHKGTANAFGVSWPSAAETDPLAAPYQTFAAPVVPAMDVPTVDNVYVGDTIRGVAGTLTDPVEQMGVLTFDVLAAVKTRFLPTDTIYINGVLEFVKALAAAQVRVRIYTAAGALVSTPLNVAYAFGASVPATITAINGGVVLTQAPLAVGEYYVMLDVAHADLPGGGLFVASGFDVAEQQRQNHIRVVDAEQLVVR